MCVCVCVVRVCVLLFRLRDGASHVLTCRHAFRSQARAIHAMSTGSQITGETSCLGGVRLRAPTLKKRDIRPNAAAMQDIAL